MPDKFQENFAELSSLIETRQYDKLSKYKIEVPEKFNWVRDDLSL